jgi:hypothetical protein
MSRDTAGRVSQIESQAGGQVQVLAANIQYHPTPAEGGGEGGLVRQFLFGNATQYVRTIDADGRVAAHTFGPGQRSLSFDPASRITALADTSPAQLQTFGYDTLDQLSGWATASTTQG